MVFWGNYKPWKCPKCKREFKNKNQVHSCAKFPLAKHFKNKDLAGLKKRICSISREDKPEFKKPMKIFIKAKPLAKEEKVEKVDEINFIVSVKEPPKHGKANRAIIRALASHFKVSPSRINLVSGFSSKQKVFEVSA